MPRDFITRSDDPSGKNVSTKKLNDTAVDYYLQDVIVNDADGTRAAVVTAPPGGSAAGLVVRAPELPLPAGAASELTLERVADAVEGVVDVAVQGTVPVSSSQLPGALGGAGGVKVEIVAGGGGGSSGTEYTEGDTDASITGQALLWEDAADTLRAVSAAKPLPVGDAGGSLTVDSPQLPAALGGGGGIKVDGSGTALPVSGTVAVSGTVPVSLAAVVPVSDNAGSLTVDSTQLPSALAANGGLKVEGVAGGVAVPVSAASLPARTRTADAITATPDGKYVVIDGVAYTILRAYVNLTSSGELIPLHASKKNRIIAAFLNNGVSTSDGTVQFKSNGSGGTALGGPIEIRIGGGMVLPREDAGWFENINVNENLYATIASIGQLSGVLLYIQV